jgi:hypothetical protein
MGKKVFITEDSESEMLLIKTENEYLFEGNYWDFNRCGSAFKEMLEAVGCEVVLEEKEYSEWYKKL